MKRKLMITVMALAVMMSSTGVSLAETKGTVSLKSCFTDIYKIFSFIINGSGQNGSLPGQDDSITGEDSKPEDNDQNTGNKPGGDTSGDAGNGTIEEDKDENSDNDQIQGGNESYQQANQILNLVNAERRKAGLSELTLNTKLNSVAQLKAEDMAKNRYFSHNSPTYGSAFDMMNNYGISYRAAGENIAKGQKSAQSVMNGWMNSSGHRANILKSNYTQLGVGYALDSNGNTYWVQMFIG